MCAEQMDRGEDSGALVVEVVFYVSDEQHGRTVVAQMIDRAQEIANLPECECDLDVNVRWSSSLPPAGTQQSLE
jgi:hypothetical protein